eukprot:SAG31_NODE_5529_length_2475_cov_2.029040_4_plen_116_part_00
MLETDGETRRPTHFTVNASFEFMLQPRAAIAKGSIKLDGDWGGSATTLVQLPATNGLVTPLTVSVCASITASVPNVELWWPLHYGKPNLHNLTAKVRQRGCLRVATWNVSSLAVC